MNAIEISPPQSLSLVPSVTAGLGEVGLTGPALEAMAAENTGEQFATLVTLSHPNFSEVIRRTDAGKAISSQGEVFSYLPMTGRHPTKVYGQPSKASLSTANVDNQILELLDSVFGPIDCKLQVVRVAAPEEILFEWDRYAVTTTPYDGAWINFSIGSNLGLDTPHGAHFRPDNSPALFK